LVNEHIRHDWTAEEAAEVYGLPLTDLVYRAQSLHRRFHDPSAVQRCTLLSIQTGGCPEDCAYCPQSAHYPTGVRAGRLLDRASVLAVARSAQQSGATRFCMGASWGVAREGALFDEVLAMVRDVAGLGMEVCTTLGQITPEQAKRLKTAGLTAYNHNLDSSREFYPSIITTHTFEDRLETVRRVQEAGISVCCGGIVGMGETARDRCAMLAQIGRFDPHPESVPINLLMRMPGTPLAQVPDLDPIELVRTIATARVVAPRARVRLSAGRMDLTREAQALCFVAGANSVFCGERLLTAPNPSVDEDERLMACLGLRFQS
jgi:biotin synthase